MSLRQAISELDPRTRRRNAAYRAVFAGPVGELVLADLLNFCGVGRFCPEVGEPLARQEGMRRVGLHVATIVGLDDTAIMRRVQQAIDSQNTQTEDADQ